MHELIEAVNNKSRKAKVVLVKSGDTVRVHQKIREGSKERVQVFEGLVINVRRKNSHTNTITVRRIASGVGVEKTFLLHSPLVEKVEVVKRANVRRNKLSYMKKRAGKSARLSAIDFDRDLVNEIPDPEVKEEPKSESEEKIEKPEEVKEAPKEEKKEEPKAEAKEDKADKSSKEEKEDKPEEK